MFRTQACSESPVPGRAGLTAPTVRAGRRRLRRLMSLGHRGDRLEAGRHREPHPIIQDGIVSSPSQPRALRGREAGARAHSRPASAALLAGGCLRAMTPRKGLRRHAPLTATPHPSPLAWSESIADDKGEESQICGPCHPVWTGWRGLVRQPVLTLQSPPRTGGGSGGQNSLNREVVGQRRSVHQRCAPLLAPARPLQSILCSTRSMQMGLWRWLTDTSGS